MNKLHSRPDQRGAILVVTMIMLVLLTLISVSVLRSTTMDEKMAGNARDRDKALQAAEAAARVCLDQLTSATPTYSGTKLTPTAPPAVANWDVASNWTNNSVAVTMTDAGLAAAPRCLAEDLGGGLGYRVTARAVGGSDLAVVMIQATYSTD